MHAVAAARKMVQIIADSREKIIAKPAGGQHLQDGVELLGIVAQQHQDRAMNWRARCLLNESRIWVPSHVSVFADGHPVDDRGRH